MLLEPTIIQKSNSETSIVIGDFEATLTFEQFKADRLLSMFPNGAGGLFYNQSWAVTKSLESKTGLFPVIHSCIKQATEDFIRINRPDAVTVFGRDSKRNEFNSREYKKFDTRGYAFYETKNILSPTASDTGVIGIAWFKDGVDVPERFRLA